MNRLENITRLFEAAQLLAPNDTDAGLLFREAFEGSVSDSDADQTGDDDLQRRSFYAKLISILRDSSPTDGTAPSPTQSAVRGRVAREVFDRHFAPAFAQLSQGEQLLLFLTAVEGFDIDSIAEITGFESDHTERQLESVFDKIGKLVADASGNSLRNLIGTSVVPQQWIEQNLQAFTRNHLDRPGVQTQRFIESRLNTGIGSTPLSPMAEAPLPRSASKKNDTQRVSKLRSKWLPAVATVVIVGMIGLFASQQLDASESTAEPQSVFELSIENAGRVAPVLETEDPNEAQRFIRTHFGRIISPPSINSASITGVGSTELVPGLRVPSMLYKSTANSKEIVVFGLSYATLNELADTVTIGEDVYRSLEEAGAPSVHDIGERPVVIWRDADDIFLAVLPKGYENPEALI